MSDTEFFWSQMGNNLHLVRREDKVSTPIHTEMAKGTNYDNKSNPNPIPLT